MTYCISQGCHEASYPYRVEGSTSEFPRSMDLCSRCGTQQTETFVELARTTA
jgi:hypothetical protein